MIFNNYAAINDLGLPKYEENNSHPMNCNQPKIEGKIIKKFKILEITILITK
jgi:hypothetical protein